LGRHLYAALVREYVEHYHRERNHQGLENRLLYAPTLVPADGRPIGCHARLGGTLNFYYRKAA
jgi:putative transposase